MISGNPSQSFYIQYERDIDGINSRYKEDLGNRNLSDLLGMAAANCKFELTTLYPGLSCGAGYAHPAVYKVNPNDKTDVSDFQLGFSLDHTAGMPVIPGSSVKGVLKSVFPFGTSKFYTEKLNYIIDTFKAENKVDTLRELADKNKYAPETVSFVLDTIFFGQRQVFFDAYPAAFNRQQRLLEEDYITPHTNGIFKEPTPLRFMKIAPEVPICFQFKLHDTEKVVLPKPEGDKAKTAGTDKDKKDTDTPVELKIAVSTGQKRLLFQRILVDFGIGAKRNTGYGAFKKPAGT